MESISTNQFKKETYHRPMEYKFYRAAGGVREFKTDKFYFNKDYRVKMWSMPSFMLGFEGKMFKKSNKEYVWFSKSGRTEFKCLD